MPKNEIKLIHQSTLANKYFNFFFCVYQLKAYRYIFLFFKFKKHLNKFMVILFIGFISISKF